MFHLVDIESIEFQAIHQISASEFYFYCLTFFIAKKEKKLLRKSFHEKDPIAT